MLIKVKVITKAKKQEVIKKGDDSFLVKIRQAPEKGLANKAVTANLAVYFKIPERDIKLVKGAKQRNKIFSINEKKSLLVSDTNRL